AKELALLNEHVSPAEALAMGLVNRVCARADLDRTVAGIVEKARAASPTANAHTKRLLHGSFHRDPREQLEDVLKAEDECVTWWEREEPNRGCNEKVAPGSHPPRPRP